MSASGDQTNRKLLEGDSNNKEMGSSTLTTGGAGDGEETATATDTSTSHGFNMGKPKLSKRQLTVIALDGVPGPMMMMKQASLIGESGGEEGLMPGAGANNIDPNLGCISFLLCLFDNIVGPKIVHHWLLDARQVELVDVQLLKYVAVHTLNGELYQEKLHSNLKYRLYLIREIDRAIFSVFFDASTISTASSTAGHYSTADLLGMSSFDSSSSSTTTAGAAGETTGSTSSLSSQPAMSSSALKRHHAASLSKLNATTVTSLNSFSLIVPLERKDILLKFYGDATRFFINAFENIIMEFKVYAHIKPKINHTTRAIENLTQMLTEFVGDLVTLRNRGIYPSFLSERDQLNKMEFNIHIKDTYLNDCYFTTPMATSSSMNEKQNFLINAITSHLITNCRTIVIGKSSASINKLINTLGLFMPKELLRISCYALEENSMLSPYFCLQGFVTETPEDLNSFLTIDFLFKRDSPTTIIDLSHKLVYRTPILNEFFALKEEFIRKKVKFLYNSLSLADLRTVYPVNIHTDNPYKLIWISSSSIAQKSTLISSMLKQMDILDIENGTKHAYLNLVLKDIYMLSVSLIEYVNNEITTHGKATKSDASASVFKLPTRKVCRDLDIKSDEDLHILLAHANYLKPGFTLDFNLT